MAGFVLMVGYDYDEFRELQEVGSANGIVYDHAAAAPHFAPVKAGDLRLYDLLNRSRV